MESPISTTNNQLLMDMYRSIVVPRKTEVNDSTIGTSTTTSGNQTHRTSSKYSIAAASTTPINGIKYIQHLQTIVWPEFVSIVNRSLQKPQNTNDEPQQRKDNNNNHDNNTNNVSIQQLSMNDLAILIAYLISMKYSSLNYYGNGILDGSSFDFVVTTTTNSTTIITSNGSDTNETSNNNTDSNNNLKVWEIWCQIIFGDNSSRDQIPKQYSNNKNSSHDYLDATIRVHCLNILWTCLSQQYYNLNDTSIGNSTGTDSCHNATTRSNHHELLVSKRYQMFQILCDYSISTSEIYLHMPLRYRECYIRRKQQYNNSTHQNTKPNDPQPSSSFLIRTIQKLLYVLESDMILFTAAQNISNSNEEINDTEVEMNANESNDTTGSKSNNCYGVSIWQYIHRTIEMLCDLLSTPPIIMNDNIPDTDTDLSNQSHNNNSSTKILFDREPMIEYFFSIHFMIRCTNAINRIVGSIMNQTNTNQDFDKNSVVLVHQLLHRLFKYVYCFPTMIIPNPVMTVSKTFISFKYNQLQSIYHGRAIMFQKICHRYYKEQLLDIIYTGPGLLCNNNSNNNNQHSSRNVGSTIHKLDNLMNNTKNETSYLRQGLDELNDHELYTLLYKMRLVDHTLLLPQPPNNGNVVDMDIESNLTLGCTGPDDKTLSSFYSDRNFLLSILEEYLTIPNDPLKELQTFPLYPTEALLWDYAQLPSYTSQNTSSLANENYYNHHVLSIPKLSTRYINFIDYLSRNFELMRLESAYEIRSDLIDIIRRLQPEVHYLTSTTTSNEGSTTKTIFKGWARMTLEMKGIVEIKKVYPPLLGEVYPSQVIAEFCIDLHLCNHTLRKEWDELNVYDNLFLVAIDASKKINEISSIEDTSKGNEKQRIHISDDDESTFPQRYGVTLVRGCMILQIRDEFGTALGGSNDPSTSATSSSTKNTNAAHTENQNHRSIAGTKLIFRVAFDPTQYSIDRSASPVGTDIYNTLNLVVRRSGRVNNFKAVLETIRSVMVGIGSIDRVVPVWLQSAILGHGDPKDSSYQSKQMEIYAKSTIGVPNPDALLDYGDTFIDEDHLQASFLGLSSSITFDERSELISKSQADPESDKNKSDQPRRNYKVRVIHSVDCNASNISLKVEAISYQFRGGTNEKGNLIRFTPRQVAAIRSGLSPGLSLIVGPPGSKLTTFHVFHP
jgi:hypothetical protein